jgi:hypothetical protein
VSLGLNLRFKNPKGIGWQDMDWIILPQDRKRWQAVVSMVMNIPIS